MIKPVSWLIAIIFLLFITGCNRDDGPGCPEDYSGPLTTEERDLAAVWRLFAMEGSVAVDLTDDQVNNPDTDLFSQLDDCSVLASYNFSEDRKATYNASEPNDGECVEKLLFDGTWKFESGMLYLAAGCFYMEVPAKFDTSGSYFSFTVEEEVRNYRDQLVMIEVTYTFIRVFEAL